MKLSEALLPEFDQEMASTRKTLERVPDDRFEWRPHEKSMTMIGLASHLANLLTWAVHTVNEDSIDIAPEGAPPPSIEPAKSRAELLETFDRNVAAAREAIAGASDEHLMKLWSLQAGGKTLMTMPRLSVLRSFIMSHSIHHRAQLGVYLRLNDVPVPSVYGPTADETPF